MSHKHPVYDSDPHFTIDPITRKIVNQTAGKTKIIQYDHNSERFTFDIPRLVDGHDMSLCDKIEVHYINLATSGGAQNADVYLVQDVAVNPETDEVTFSWLLSQNATQLVGSLSFLIRFSCLDGDKPTYVWNTDINAEIIVSNGMYNSEAVAAEYSDILEAWKAEVLADMSAPIDEAKDAEEGAQTAQAAAEQAATRAEEAANRAEESSTALNGVLDLYTSPNLLNKETLTKGVGISANGTEYASAANAVTDYISVKEGDVLSWQHLKTDGSNKTVIGSIRFVCAYDNNKNILSSKGSDSTIKSYEVPNGVAYVRITMQSYTNYINQMVHFGTDILAYEPYESYYVIKEKAISNEVIENIAKEISESNSRPLTLPPTIYGFVGYPISIYFRNVMDYYPDDVYVRKYGASVKGKQYADRWEYTPTAAETVSGSIMVYDHNYNKLNDQSIPVEVKDSTIKDNLSVLVIGDSTVNAGKETQKMIDLAASDGYNLTLLGTRGSGANKHEGRSGWTAKMYVETAESNSIANAFYGPTTETFDFAYYMTQQGYSGVDCVFLQLGINDVFSATELTLADALNTYLSNMEIIINSIRAYDANIKIVINLVIPCGTDQDAFTGTYNLSTTTWRCKKNTYEANIALLNKFKSITNVYLSPYNAAIDTVNNLPKDVHPNDAGYEQLGTQMYSYMRAIN